jgi:hypothetical protein
MNSTLQTPSAALQAAQQLHRQNRTAGWSALNELFRSGRAPEAALNGRYRGQLIALNIAPGLTQLGEWLSGLWLPWQGKTFDAAQASGDNIFTNDSRLLGSLFFPLYRRYLTDTADTYRAFAFRTYMAPGKSDPDRPVLKIDYDLPGNPRLNVRRVLDELVQLDDSFYLGKAHLHWWWGHWQLVAYFSLAPM